MEGWRGHTWEATYVQGMVPGLDYVPNLRIHLQPKQTSDLDTLSTKCKHPVSSATELDTDSDKPP